MSTLELSPMRKPIRARYLAPYIHALLYLAMWGLYWAFAQPLANGPVAPLFFLLFIADFPISFVAFGVLFTSSQFGTVAAILWGLVGTLWWYLVGWLIDAGIPNFRKMEFRITNRHVPAGDSGDNSSVVPAGEAAFWNQRREWLIAGVLVVVLIFVSLAWSWNGPGGSVQSGGITLGAFTPDGRCVLLSRSHGNSSFLYKVALDTGVSVRLTRASSGIESSPAYSPDSKQMVFLYALSKDDRPRIFIVDTISGIAHALFTSEANGDDYSPRFTPDGNRIYFARTKSLVDGSPSGQSVPRWDLYSVDLKGEDLRALTDEHFQGFSTLSFSTDGKKLVYSTEGERGSELHLYSLGVPSGPEERLQFNVPENRASPIYSGASLSPSGQQVYFLAPTSVRDKPFDYDVYKLEIANNSVEKLTESNGYSTDLCISSDGANAVFLRWTSRWNSLPNISRMYLLNLVTKSLKPLNVTGTQ